jgi:transcriptional regulator NrdR family protein
VICPNCNSDSSSVVRTVSLKKQTVRMRRCKKCNFIFETIEDISPAYRVKESI